LAKHRNGTCPVDLAQNAMIQVWNDLRTRHAHIAVLADVGQLTDAILEQAKERVLLSFPCLMDQKTWRFYKGEEAFETFQSKTKDHPFRHHHLTTLAGGSCPAERSGYSAGGRVDTN
jgi:hypothetical protein